MCRTLVAAVGKRLEDDNVDGRVPEVRMRKLLFKNRQLN